MYEYINQYIIYELTPHEACAFNFSFLKYSPWLKLFLCKVKLNIIILNTLAHGVFRLCKDLTGWMFCKEVTLLSSTNLMGKVSPRRGFMWLYKMFNYASTSDKNLDIIMMIFRRIKARFLKTLKQFLVSVSCLFFRGQIYDLMTLAFIMLL